MGGKVDEPGAKVQRRKASELVHHQIEADRWPDVAASLCDLKLLEARFTADLDITLLEEYGEALKRGPDVQQWPKRKEVEEFFRFVRSEAHILRDNPTLTFQQAANQPTHTTPAIVANLWWNNGQESRPWLLLKNKPQQLSPCIFSLSGHTGAVTACAYSPDGKYILSASKDRTLKIWDAETGMEHQTFAGDNENIY